MKGWNCIPIAAVTTQPPPKVYTTPRRGSMAGLASDFISNNVKSPGASFVLFLGADMIMKFNAK